MALRRHTKYRFSRFVRARLCQSDIKNDIKQRAEEAENDDKMTDERKLESSIHTHTHACRHIKAF